MSAQECQSHGPRGIFFFRGNRNESIIYANGDKYDVNADGNTLYSSSVKMGTVVGMKLLGEIGIST